ncbi:MAG: hypothetical protein FWC64_13305 [Treponema sp.]|nr:hypothetical protein [Treponema sp.]
MGDTEKIRIRKIQRRTTGAIVGAALLLSALTVFPVLNFQGTRIPLFALERITSFDRFYGRILGDQVLETEHGEIRLRHLSEVFGVNLNLADIDFREFEAGRASHNLVVHGIEIPPNVTVSFNRFDRISLIQMHGSRLSRQEIIVSGIPVRASRITLNPRGGGDMLIGGGGGHRTGVGIITLADSTQILSGDGSLRTLLIFKAEERWEMQDRVYSILVKLPGEAEFSRYRTITFRPDWGEFIEGELWEQ